MARARRREIPMTTMSTNVVSAGYATWYAVNKAAQMMQRAPRTLNPVLRGRPGVVGKRERGDRVRGLRGIGREKMEEREEEG